MSDFELPVEPSDAAFNPFAAPKANLSRSSDIEIDIADAERIRRDHIGAEAGLRALGTLNYIGSFFIGLSGLMGLLAGLATTGDVQTTMILSSFIYFGLATCNYLLGRGLRNLKNWARICEAVLCIPAIISPISWLILYYTLNKKAVFVCTPEYAAIREATPHIKYKTSLIVKFLAFLLLAIIVILIIVVASQ